MEEKKKQRLLDFREGCGEILWKKKRNKSNNKCNGWGLEFVKRSTNKLEGLIANIIDRSNKL